MVMIREDKGWSEARTRSKKSEKNILSICASKDWIVLMMLVLVSFA